MIHAVTVQENIWIAMPDGRRLAARLWLPEGEPQPAVIEYMPYRKRDSTRPRDEPIHAWLAARGYACLRVDVTGSGDSDGVLNGMFETQEQDDAVAVIAWAAAQPWCNGAVAMLGKSWGGYAGMQAAMHRPPALKAIVTVCAGDDRYDQALQFVGGALLNETLWWTEAMLLFNIRPPDPEISGPDWRRKWQERLDANRPMILDWLKHQRRDAYWQHGSLCEDYPSVQCAVFAVGGWADYLSRSVLRMVAGVKAPVQGLVAQGLVVQGLVGPWRHHYPQDGVPGPAIGFLQECDRFLAAVMKGAPPTGEPALRAWMPEYRVPAPMHQEQRGRWVAERQWPSPRIVPHPLFLNRTGLEDAPRHDAMLHHRSPQSIGLCAHEWLSQGAAGEAALDQREDDGKSLVFDTPPLTERLEILGSTVLELELAVDQPMALIAARLNDVAPDGTSLRVSLGILNLTHRDSDSAPTPMVPGQKTRIRLVFPETAHSFAPGHRIRIALSTSYWPIVWPSPVPVTLSIAPGTGRVILPRRPPDSADAALRAFDPPDSAPGVPVTILEPPRVTRTLTRDLMTGASLLEIICDGGMLGPGRRYRLDPLGTVLGHRFYKRCEIRDDDPLSAVIDITQQAEFERGDWNIRLETHTRFHATATDFHIEADARAYEGGVLVHERSWQEAIPRDLM